MKRGWIAELIASIAAIGIVLSIGCVRRTIVITTDPPNALVFLNDQEIGHSEVKTDFLWYGDYDVIIRKDGYETLKTHWKVNAPWYQLMPFDFIAEVLWPGRIHDVHTGHFTLEPAVQVSSDELVEQALAIREQALNSPE